MISRGEEEEGHGETRKKNAARVETCDPRLLPLLREWLGVTSQLMFRLYFPPPLFRDTIERTDSIVSNSIFLSINVESTRLDYHASYTKEITYLNLCLCM